MNEVGWQGRQNCRCITLPLSQLRKRAIEPNQNANQNGLDALSCVT